MHAMPGPAHTGPPSAGPAPQPADEVLAEAGAALGAALAAALGPWVEGAVARVHARLAGPPPPAVVAAARDAGERATAELAPALQALLAADVDAQRTTPLSLVRSAVRYPTEVLAEAGVTPVRRDAASVERFPDDPYDLTPAAYADLGPEVGELGLVWGAAKAHAHLARHRPSPPPPD
jgi:hypothetical protein